MVLMSMVSGHYSCLILKGCLDFLMHISPFCRLEHKCVQFCRKGTSRFLSHVAIAVGFLDGSTVSQIGGGRVLGDRIGRGYAVNSLVLL